MIQLDLLLQKKQNPQKPMKEKKQNPLLLLHQQLKKLLQKKQNRQKRIPLDPLIGRDLQVSQVLARCGLLPGLIKRKIIFH